MVGTAGTQSRLKRLLTSRGSIAFPSPWESPQVIYHAPESREVMKRCGELGHEAKRARKETLAKMLEN